MKKIDKHIYFKKSSLGDKIIYYNDKQRKNKMKEYNKIIK